MKEEAKSTNKNSTTSKNTDTNKKPSVKPKKNAKRSNNMSLGKIILGIISIPMYAILGIYYIVYLPFKAIATFFSDIYYSISTSGRVKKVKQVNYAKEVSSSTVRMSSKNIYAKMAANKKNIKKIQKDRLSKKQKETVKKNRDLLLAELNSKKEKRLEEPKIFEYKAINLDGKIEKNTFVGVSKLDIYTFLTSEGYIVYSIESNKWTEFLYGTKPKNNRPLSTKNVIFFITQLETYVKAGVTLTEAMRLLSRQLSKDKTQHRIMQSIVYYLTMGETFSSALEHQGSAFPPLLVNMIKAAEAAGTLDETLEDMDNYYTELNTTKKDMISAMTYPVIVTVFSIVVITIIMIKIVPQFVSIYNQAGAKVTGLTAFVINVSNFTKKYALIVAVILVLIITALVLAYKNVQPFRRQCQVIAMKMPVIGKIIIYNEITIFTKTFASLLKNDVVITDSIEILSKITNNEIYKEIMLDTINNITKGDKISESFKDNWAVPDIAYYMIVTGENTGQLSEMMSKVSYYYSEQHKSMINTMKSLIEPIMIIFLAAIVGGVMIAVVMPMFNLYSTMLD